jgi:predicted outer membrane repeat protein
VVISECILSNNRATQGGAIYCDTNAGPTILNCRIVNNTATGWGGGLAFATGCSSPRILGCVIAGNTAGTEGGGVYFAGSGNTHQIVNSTIADNSSAGQAGGVFVTSSAGVAIANSILWGNDAAAIAGPGMIDVRFSDVEGGFAGLGNLDDDPMFADASYRIRALSPCVDAGDNDAVPPILEFDIRGRPRIQDGNRDSFAIVDQGAFELPQRLQPRLRQEK